MTSAVEIDNTPFEGGANDKVSPDELLKLIDSLKVVSTDSKLQALIDAAKNGQSVDRDTVTEVVSIMLAETEGLGDLAGSIGEFDFKFM